jgi:prophage DNA circulation protein
MTCICIDELQPASFRGVGFYVKNDKGAYGRRIVTHEYPMRDNPYNEDMGEKAQKFSVTAYVFGDNWISAKDAVIAAARAKGPAILQLPTEGSKLVVCNSLGVARNKDECGYFELTLEFTASTNNSNPGPVGVFESIIGAAFNNAIPALTTIYDYVYTTDNVLPYVTDNMNTRITDFANAVMQTMQSNPVTDTDQATDIVQAAISTVALAQVYAQPDSNEAVSLASQPICADTVSQVADITGVTAIGDGGTVSISSGAAAIVPMIAYMINGIGNTMLPSDAFNALLPLAQYSIGEVNPLDLPAINESSYITETSNAVSPSDTADAYNGQIFCGCVRSFALMKLAQAISVIVFTTRAQAIQARATIVELFDMQIAMFTEDAIVDVLLVARDNCVTAVTQRMTSIVPIVKITAPMSKPSLYWANRLYQDVTRAQDLADRNDVSMPAYMPKLFEALSS